MLRLYRTAVSGRVRTSYTPACGGCATVPRSRSAFGRLVRDFRAAGSRAPGFRIVTV